MKTRKSSDKFNFIHKYFFCYIQLAPDGSLNIIVAYDETRKCSLLHVKLCYVARFV